MTNNENAEALLRRLWSAFFKRPVCSRCNLVFLAAFLLVCLCSVSAQAQLTQVSIAKTEIKHVGPQSVSDELIRSHIRVKPGDTYTSQLALQAALDDDVRGLYSTGFFYNIQVSQTSTPDGLVLTYIVQA